MKESIVIYARQRTALKRLTDAQRGVLFDALLTYAGGEEPTFTDGMVMIAFDFFRAQIDIDGAKYEEVSIKRREAGRQGGLAKKANVTKSKQNVANATKPKQNVANATKPKQNVHDNDNVNDNVNDNDNDSVEATTLPTRTRERFVKPTINERTAYVLEKGYTFNPQAFYDSYEANGWRVGKNPMKKWKAACANWQRMEQERKQDLRHGNNNEHPTNSELIRNTYDIITELRQLDEQGVPAFRDF
jgi:hypothetical protein